MTFLDYALISVAAVFGRAARHRSVAVEKLENDVYLTQKGTRFLEERGQGTLSRNISQSASLLTLCWDVHSHQGGA